jgi:hypothetical protein
MATNLPVKTKIEDIQKLLDYLQPRVGWTGVETAKTAIGTAADTRKIEAMRFLGLVDRDGSNFKLTAVGREMAGASADDQARIMRERLSAIALYRGTLDWIHYQSKTQPTKADVSNHWLDNYQGALGDIGAAALSDTVTFFFRVMEMAGLGMAVNAGRGREAHVKVDAEALAALVTGTPSDSAEADEAVDDDGEGAGRTTSQKKKGLTLDPSLTVNVEIHIAADATGETVEAIFRNLHKYLIDGPEHAE